MHGINVKQTWNKAAGKSKKEKFPKPAKKISSSVNPGFIPAAAGRV
ncbi:hypothetical protein [Acinetobacter terrestris]|nr:hypothetical protein [Acinetobacter terrestris]